MNLRPLRPTLRILGTRGVPAAHGGFETFAERLALYLVAEGWQVVVYSQAAGEGPLHEDVWNGVHRVLIPSGGDSAAATVRFDWRCISHARRNPRDLCLTLGYNTAMFSLRLRSAGIRNVINMDGIEWRRAKWSPLVKTWFWLNDWAGCWLADHLVADHPEIAVHLRTRTADHRISTILYGADRVCDASEAPLQAWGLEPGRYVTLVARSEPENSVLELVRAYSSRRRGLPLLVVGNVGIADAYGRKVRAAASDEVLFAGPVYEGVRLAALRRHALLHLHGHQVGGTNPSLVEALAASNAVLAFDNTFNRWVAGDAARYFRTVAGCDEQLAILLADASLLRQMSEAAAARFEQAFSWDGVLAAYHVLLRRFLQPEQQAWGTASTVGATAVDPAVCPAGTQ